MKKIYKAAVIGGGNIGAGIDIYKKNVRPGSHAESYLRNKRFELCAIVETNKERYAYLNKHYRGVKIYDKYDKMEDMLLAVKPDIVSVATPTKDHFNPVVLAASQKVPVILCEKPLSYDLQEAKTMIKKCRENGAKLFVNHNRHYDRLMIKWSQKIKNGLLGNLEQAMFQYYNGLYNNGTHFLDLVMMFVGKPIYVMARKNKKTSWNENDINVDGLLFFENGLTLSIQSLSKNYGYQNVKIFGEKGMLEIGNMTYEIRYRKKIKNKNFKNFFQLDDKCQKEGGERSWMAGVIEYFAEYLDGKKQAISTGEDGLAVLKVLESLKKSASLEGKIVKINY